MPLYLVEGSTVPVVSVDDMKAHLHVDHDDDDALIELYTAAATARLDGRDGLLQRALVAQTWDLKLERFPGCMAYGASAWNWPWITLPLPPLLSVDFVKYFDADDSEQTWDAGSYHVVGVGGGQPGRIQLRDSQSWPSISTSWPEPVTVRFTAGHLDPTESPDIVGEVPPAIVQAIKLITGHLYANRESVVVGVTAVEVPQSALWLLEPFKVYV